MDAWGSRTSRACSGLRRNGFRHATTQLAIHPRALPLSFADLSGADLSGAVRLNKNRTQLLTATRKLRDSSWTDYAPLNIFRSQDAVQPNETISDQVWIEVPDNGEAALLTDFVVAKVVEDVDGGTRGWGYIKMGGVSKGGGTPKTFTQNPSLH
jgi:hypothetical protein